MTKNVLPGLLVLFLLFAVLPVSIGQTADGCAISPVEAAHLVESRVPRFTTIHIEPGMRDNTPIYLLEGRSGSDGYRAVVDARIARVLTITKNGEPFYEWPGIIVAGHRGNVSFAPENTIAALNKGIELGADLVEIDIRETKDGHLVIMHDSSVDRTTSGKGKIAELTLEEIKAFDAGSWFSEEYKGEKVPTLDEALSAIEGRALPDLDFKAGTPGKLIAALEKHNLLGKVTLYCGSWDLLQSTLQENKQFEIRPTVPFGRIGLPILLEKLNPPIVNMDWPQFTESLVLETHLLGKKAFVNVMGANDTEFGMLRAMDAGADYLQSDHLDLLMPLLRARGLHK